MDFMPPGLRAEVHNLRRYGGSSEHVGKTVADRQQGVDLLLGVVRGTNNSTMLRNVTQDHAPGREFLE
jgi:hypothetical protein